jgi:hypothetical protein
MKKTILLILALAMVKFSFAQNKKEQIEILNNRVDSLKIAFQNENSIKKIEIEKLESTSKDLEVQKNNLQLKIADLNASISEFKLSNYLLKDSLNVCLKNIIKLDSAYQNALQKIVELNDLLVSKKDSIKLPVSKKPINSQSINDQTPTLIFTIEKGIPYQNENEIVAVPFVMFKNGKYKAIPICEREPFSTELKVLEECRVARETILPIVEAGQSLYILNNGIQSGIVNIEKHTGYGYSDWQTFSAILSTNPNVKLVTNNSLLGTKSLKELNSKPILKKRKGPLGVSYEDKLLSKVDIDGDTLPELIYLCDDYEGYYYIIYSFKNNKWIKVFEGGYQGS